MPHPTAGPTPSAAANTPLTVDDVKAHKTDKDCWVIIDGKVYDVTEFLPDHPGGKKAIVMYAGKDASEEFGMLHKPEVLKKYASGLQVGVIKGAGIKSNPTAASGHPTAGPTLSAAANTPLTADQVKAHKTDKDCWVIIEGKVYDVTEFLPDHPGGKKAIVMYAGKDASEEFGMLHKPEVLKKYASGLQVGVISKL